MMDLSTIRYLSEQAGREACEHDQVPYVPETQAEIDGYRRFPFPNLGAYQPPGWREVDRHFVDKSGLGEEWEPALTPAQFKAVLKPGRGYAIVEEGQFQLYVGEFVRDPDAGGNAEAMLAVERDEDEDDYEDEE